MKSVILMDYLVIGFYMVLTLGVGFYFMKFNKGASDFFKGGNKIPWLVAGLSAFMSGFSAWTFTGAAGVAYKDGIAIVLMYFGNAISFMVGYFLFAAKWRRTRISTTMEYLSERFDQPTRQTFSWTTVFFDLFIVASTLYGMGIFISATCNFPIVWTIIVSGAIIVAYCFLGGLWAVVITDFLQGIILIPFTMVLAGVALYQIGGFSDFINALPKEMLSMSGHTERSTWTYVICWTMMIVFGYNTRAHAQRYFSVDSEKSAKKIAFLNFVLFFFGTCIWFIPPMAMRVIYPDLSTVWTGLSNPEEGAYAVASLTLLPNGLIGIMLAAMFSASMSTISSFYNMHAGIISKDIYPRFTQRDISEKEMLVIGRITTLVIGIIVPLFAVLMARSGRSVFTIMVKFNTIISLGYGPPALLGLVYKRTPHWSGMMTFAVAIVMGSLGTFVYDWGLIENALIITPASIAVFLMSGLFVRQNTGHSFPYALIKSAFLTLPIILVISIVRFAAGSIVDLPLYACMIVIGASFVMMFMVSILFSIENENQYEQRQSFFKKMATPIDLKTEVGETSGTDSVVFLFLAKVTMVIGLICLVFLIWADKQEWSTIIVYSLITLGLAGLFLGLSRSASQKQQDA